MRINDLPLCLKMERNERAKRIRKDYEAHRIKERRGVANSRFESRRLVEYLDDRPERQFDFD